MEKEKTNLVFPAVLAAGLAFPPLFFPWITSFFHEVVVIPAVFSLSEQFIIVIAGFVLKPLYQIISLIIVVMLWKRKEEEPRSLKNALIAFLIGENACALNYLIYREQNFLMEYVHTYGMAVCFGFVAYAIMEFLDKRVFIIPTEAGNALFIRCAADVTSTRIRIARCGDSFFYSFPAP